MGWSLRLKADKDIKVEDVETVLENAIRVTWGWKTMGVDINLPEGRELRLSGAWYSVDCAKPAARVVKNGLKKLGYEIWAGKVG